MNRDYFAEGIESISSNGIALGKREQAFETTSSHISVDLFGMIYGFFLPLFRNTSNRQDVPIVLSSTSITIELNLVGSEMTAQAHIAFTRDLMELDSPMSLVAMPT